MKFSIRNVYVETNGCVKWQKRHAVLSTAILSMALFAGASHADITSGNVSTAYENPFAGKTIASFNWGSDNNLYWMEGDSSWAQEMKVHKYNGSTLSTIYTASAYAGNWILSNGNNVYFDNGSEYALYKYDTVVGGSAAQAHQQTNAWGYSIHNGGLFISGSDSNWNNKLYYIALGQDGNTTGSLVDLGFMGGPSGPMAFDASGNLYYASGYSAGKIYKYSAAEIASAISGTPLSNPAAHEFIDFNSFGYQGATGMEFDSNGHLVVTLTDFYLPSILVTFYTDVNGNYLSLAEVTATSNVSMTSVRNHQGNIYFSDNDGIYQVVPGVNTDADRYPDTIDADDDNDGIADGQDAFPLNPLESLDTDADGIGNNGDGDDDGDDVTDAVDAEPLNAANAQEIVLPMSGNYKGSVIKDRTSQL